MSEKIKILTTLGPASSDRFIIKRMDAAGVDIFRINLSHTKSGDFLNVLKNIRTATDKPICVDSEGAQIRTGSMRNGQVILEKNSIVNLVKAEFLGNSKNIPLYPIKPCDILREGDILYLDFNNAILQITGIENKIVKAKVLEGGVIGSNKGVNVNRKIDLPAFTEKDLKIFRMAKRKKINYVALSFASSKNDVVSLRKIFVYPIFLISKIENKKGVENFEEICKASDAVLIDRGDLSRDVPLEKIGLIQKHIIEKANVLKKPVYVATNLLETMIEKFKPTRAEINDITNTLLSGANGLVLAAETAIGKYPVESVNMVKSVIEEVNEYQKNKNGGYFNYIFEYNLIEPHGGFLVQNFAEKEWMKDLPKMNKLRVSERILLDVVQIAEGLYSPLKGFMGYGDLMSVLDNYKLSDGTVWTLPVILQSDKSRINFKKGEKIALLAERGNEPYALMDIKEIKKIDLKKIAEKWFGTNDEFHPGVVKFKNSGDHIISGEIYLIKKPRFLSEVSSLTPKQTREIFRGLGWRKIVGFHTRNVIHRGHEFVQKEALKKSGADALFISPVIGPKKKNDFTAKAILSAYDIMIKNNNYAPYPAIIGPFATYSRYSGPREAVFTAICRKNFGCSHFIIGRDHTGVGNFYGPNASQEIFGKIGDIGIKLLMFNEAYHCNSCGGTTTKCGHLENDIIKISGTKARTSLLAGEEIPEYLMRPEISRMLKKMHKDPKEKLFEDGNS